MYIITYTLNNEYCGFIHSVGISFCGCIIIQSQGYITRGKSSHWNNKLTDIVDIWRLIEQQTESPQKLVFNEYWWNLTICTNWQNIFKYIFSNKFNYTEVKAVFPFLHNLSDWWLTSAILLVQQGDIKTVEQRHQQTQRHRLQTPVSTHWVVCP